MNTIAAIFGALKEFFTWRTKVSKTPAEKEAQAIRKETDKHHEALDKWVDKKP